MNVQEANKAWVAAVVAALSTMLATLQGRPTLDGMGWAEWLIVALAAIVAGLTTYMVPNRPKVRR